MPEKKAKDRKKTPTLAKSKGEGPTAKRVGQKAEKYFYAVGRRKTSSAQVYVYEIKETKEDGSTVNKKAVKEYFPTITQQNTFFESLKLVGMKDNVRVSVLVRGGGKESQVEAARLGISRSLIKINGDFRKTLKAAGFLTRDARKVERKKPGLKKARKAPQWAKR